MLNFKKALQSSVGRKFIMGASGILLLGFLISHLAGNLTLLVPGGEPFNLYVKKLQDLGPLLLVLEIGLAGLFILHIVMAIGLTVPNRSRRGVNYRNQVSKGGPSKMNFASVNMIVTGAVLLIFLGVHIWQFRFGPSIADGYSVSINGAEARDLYRLVTEVFTNPIWVGFYVAVMAFLGFHLRHGFWSAFQSLGFAYPKYTKCIYSTGYIVAVVFAIGFLIIPIYLYLSQSGAM